MHFICSRKQHPILSVRSYILLPFSSFTPFRCQNGIPLDASSYGEALCSIDVDNFHMIHPLYIVTIQTMGFSYHSGKVQDAVHACWHDCTGTGTAIGQDWAQRLHMEGLSLSWRVLHQWESLCSHICCLPEYSCAGWASKVMAH